MLLLLYFGFSETKETFPTYREVVLENSTLAYNRHDSPFDVFHVPVEARIELQFVTLTNVIEIQQLVSYILTVVYTWTDERLKFDPALLGINQTIVPSSAIWLPTIDCYNCIDVHKMDRETESNEVMIDPSGTVFLLMKGRFDTVCKFNIAAFPFDKQYCGINFYVSLSGTAGQITLGTINGTAGQLTGSPEWDLQADGNVVLAGNALVSLQFILDRHSTFYVVMLIIPTMIVSSLCLMALTLPLDFDRGGKYSMGINGLLGLTFLLSVIVLQVPRSSRMPILAIWLLIQMIVCVFATLIGEPVRKLKKICFRRNFLSDAVIDTIVFTVIFVANLLITIFIFVLRPDPEVKFLPLVPD